MARHKNQNWSLNEGTPNATGGRTHQGESIHAALLMDLRDELQTLNRLLSCPNFTSLPHHIQSLDREVKGLRRDLKKKKTSAPLR